MSKRRIKIVQIYSTEKYDSYDVCYDHWLTDGPWEEVTEEEYEELKNALQRCNTYEITYKIISEGDKVTSQAILTAKEYIEAEKKREAARKRRLEKAAKEKEAKSRERKIKQLAKLKKELGETE